MKKPFAICAAALALLVIALFAPIQRVHGQSGYTTLWSQWIQGSLIDSTPIGSNSPSTGAFTSLNASTFTLNGAAAANQSVCGNGTSYGACGVDVYFTVTGCQLATEYNGDSACSATQNLPITAPDTSYTVFCNADYSSASGTSYVAISVATQPNTTQIFNYTEGGVYGNGSSSSSQPTPTLQCHYHHN
ncbi:MAG: hypothetical protein ACLGPM_07760 [Acidobacteriota bacterium]